MSFLYYLSGFVFSFMILMGILVTGNMAHEMTHYFDIFNKPGIVVTEICFLQAPFKNGSFDRSLNSPAASVQYLYREEVYSSEFKATVVGFVVLSILTSVCTWFFLRITENEKTKM